MSDVSEERFRHEPVMVAEVLDLLTAVPPGLAVDATAGGGGHARALLDAREDLDLLALDRDPAAVRAARQALAGHHDRVTVVQAGFERLDDVVGEHRMRGHTGNHDHPEGRDATRAVAVLFDLGVSSPQLDRPDRGFSYRAEGPLDMRMDPGQGSTAADLVNETPERELARILRRYGEERFARAIAARIVRSRPLRTTDELASAVRDAVPAPARRRGGHPARRTFQALRIAVNDELGRLDAGLDAALTVLAPRGRIAVLSYHSLEDRMVKRRFADWSTGGTHPPGLPVTRTERGGVVRLLTRRALRPGEEEARRNPRSESARLRAVERISDVHRADDGDEEVAA